MEPSEQQIIVDEIAQRVDNLVEEGKMVERPTKDKQVMCRMLPETYAALEQIAVEMDRSVSWILNDLAVKLVRERKPQVQPKAKPAKVS